jgi:hypothetical protein
MASAELSRATEFFSAGKITPATQQTCEKSVKLSKITFKHGEFSLGSRNSLPFLPVIAILAIAHFSP